MALSTVNPAVLNALTLQWSRDKANLDDQQNRRRINYNAALGKMQRQYDKTSLAGREGLADRGMFHSGAALKQAGDLGQEFARQKSEAALGLQTDLSTIARRRLETDQEYQNNKILASLGISLK